MLVIGAGPTGLAVAKALGEAKIPYVQVEATDHIGGNWAHGVYSTAHIISSRKTTEYPDFPMPPGYPDFPSAAQMLNYFKSFVAAFDLTSQIRFEHRVQLCTPQSDDTWRVDFADGTHSEFKGVIVCNGHHWARRFPDWITDYEGQVIHSKDFKHPDDLRERRVLVIGGGNSGSDIISEAARVSQHADWSLRRGYWFMPKTFFGIPSVEVLRPWLPVAAQRMVIKGLLRIVVGKYAAYGLPQPDHRIFEAHPTISTEVFHYLKHGRIHPRPNVIRADAHTLHFADGSSDTYDLVVCATGFDISFPFLPDGMVPVHNKIAELYGGMFRPEHRHLYIAGTAQPRYGIGPLLRPMAVLLSELVTLQNELTVPLGQLMVALKQTPPTTHLMDPHQLLRQMKWAHRLLPLMRLIARRKGWLGQR